MSERLLRKTLPANGSPSYVEPTNRKRFTQQMPSVYVTGPRQKASDAVIVHVSVPISLRIDEAAFIGKAFGDIHRISIYRKIADYEELGRLDMSARTTLSGATLSHHLRVLTDAALIAFRKEGRRIYYCAVPERLELYRRYLDEVAGRVNSVPVVKSKDERDR